MFRIVLCFVALFALIVIWAPTARAGLSDGFYSAPKAVAGAFDIADPVVAAPMPDSRDSAIAELKAQLSRITRTTTPSLSTAAALAATQQAPVSQTNGCNRK